MNIKDKQEVVIKCEYCGNNRGYFVYQETEYSGVAECSKCSQGININFLKKWKHNI
tara:strand:- start:537 stop:704 length:168 start_codon:yes stop_codon:yes gene_type:complete